MTWQGIANARHGIIFLITLIIVASLRQHVGPILAGHDLGSVIRTDGYLRNLEYRSVLLLYRRLKAIELVLDH